MTEKENMTADPNYRQKHYEEKTELDLSTIKINKENLNKDN